MKRPDSIWRVFRWPMIIGMLSIVGLLSALVADGVWDGVSWAALSIPVVVGWLKSRARKNSPA